jgi:hypothetical protein
LVVYVTCIALTLRTTHLQFNDDDDDDDDDDDNNNNNNNNNI